MIKDMHNRLHNWRPYLGKPALIKTTHYYDIDGEKPVIEMQRNRLKDVGLCYGKVNLRFEDGRNTEGYGSLGACPSRQEQDVCFDLERLKIYVLEKIQQDERFSTIRDSKENLSLGDRFFVLNLYPHSGEFQVTIVSVRDYSLAGIKYKGTRRHITEQDLYSKAELPALLETIMSYAGKLLGVPAPIVTAASESFVHVPRYLVNVVFEEKDKRIMALFYEDSDCISAVEVTTKLRSTLDDNGWIAIVTDTHEGTVHKVVSQ